MGQPRPYFGQAIWFIRFHSEQVPSAIERYIRQMGTYRELDLGDWVPLDIAVPEIAAALATRPRPRMPPLKRRQKWRHPLPDPDFLSRGEWIRTTDPQTPSLMR